MRQLLRHQGESNSAPISKSLISNLVGANVVLVDKFYDAYADLTRYEVVCNSNNVQQQAVK